MDSFGPDAEKRVILNHARSAVEASLPARVRRKLRVLKAHRDPVIDDPEAATTTMAIGRATPRAPSVE